MHVENVVQGSDGSIDSTVSIYSCSHEYRLRIEYFKIKKNQY